MSGLFGARDVKVRAGEPLNIKLGMAGSPNPLVEWRNGDKVIITTDRVCNVFCSNTICAVSHFVIVNFILAAWVFSPL